MMNIDILVKLIAPVVTGLGYDFWGCESLGSAHSQKLRVYIDSEKGIDVEDCSIVSRQISAVLDVEDPIVGEYVLEVSSPGIDRPLFYIQQFHRYLGKKIKLRLKVPKDRRRNFAGFLVNTDENSVYLQIDNQEVVLEYDNIHRANVDPW